MTEILVKKLYENAKLPTRGSIEAAGLDLYAISNCVIAPNSRAIVGTGISVGIPALTYLRLAPRSGLAAKFGIDVYAGVVDIGYTGDVKVILFNSSTEPFVVKEGDRIAQAILERIYLPEVVEVFALEDTERGSGGFGSTGT